MVIIMNNQGSENTVTMDVAEESIDGSYYYVATASLNGVSVRVFARGRDKAMAFAMQELGRQYLEKLRTAAADHQKK